VRKRVSFEEVEVDGEMLGEGKEDNEMDEQGEYSGEGNLATEKAELVELVLDTGLPMSCSQEHLTV
jgi:hypothetical protein